MKTELYLHVQSGHMTHWLITWRPVWLAVWCVYITREALKLSSSHKTSTVRTSSKMNSWAGSWRISNASLVVVRSNVTLTSRLPCVADVRRDGSSSTNGISSLKPRPSTKRDLPLPFNDELVTSRRMLRLLANEVVMDVITSSGRPSVAIFDRNSSHLSQTLTLTTKT